jgi:hypothetical protein
MKPAKPKKPAKRMASSFARHVDDDGQISGWTLFRRASFDRRLFLRAVPARGLGRSDMARELLQARMVLRAVVDHFDIEKMGLQ